MATNLALDDDLIREAQKVGAHPTKKAAVTTALEEYVRRHKQLHVRELFGEIDYDPDYNPKRSRHRR